MGACLNVLFGNEYKDGKKIRVSVFAHIYVDKELSDLYETEIFDLDHDGKLVNYVSGYETYEEKGFRTDSFGDFLRLMPAERLLKFLRSDKVRELMCKPKVVYSRMKENYTYLPYFEGRVQALIKMCEIFKDDSVLMYWS